jgi:hypothetical protein
VADERRAAFKGLVLDLALDLLRGTGLASPPPLVLDLALDLLRGTGLDSPTPLPLRGLFMRVGPDLPRVKADFFLRRGDSKTSSAAVSATGATSFFGLLSTFVLLLTRFSSSLFSLVLLSAFTVRL